MKAIYAGPATPHHTSYSRMRGLANIVELVGVFNQDVQLPSNGVSRVERWLENGLSLGRRVSAANSALVDMIQRAKPDFVWIDKGEWVWQRTARQIQEMGTRVVLHTTDNLRPSGIRNYLIRRNTRALVDVCDAFLTTNVADYETLKPAQQGRLLLTDLGYDDIRFTGEPLSPRERERFDADVVFAGRWEPFREEGMLALVRAGLKVRIYGVYWDKARRWKELRDFYRGCPSDVDYVSALKGARVATCFVSRVNKAPSAGRLFEISACGIFLLAERTSLQVQYFEEGKEADFFSTIDEMAAKVARYLGDDTLRRKLAAAGRTRCLLAPYSWRDIMRRDLALLVPILSAPPRKDTSGKRNSVSKANSIIV